MTSHQGERSCCGIGQFGESKEAPIGFWWGRLRERDHLEDDIKIFFFYK